MSCIRYEKETQTFTLCTARTLYAFRILNGVFPVHLYYGKKEGAEWADSLSYLAFAPFYAELGTDYLPDVAMSEYSGYDSGDFRTCSLRLRNRNGDSATFLTYEGHRIFSGRNDLSPLPCAEADGQTETLELILKDAEDGCTVRLFYTVFPEHDVISRSVTVQNGAETDVSVEKIMSLTLDLPDHDYEMISFHGRHSMERQQQRVPLHYGAQNIFSRRGATSHQLNPFFVLCRPDTTHAQGEAYGFNFVYSGSFLNEVEVDQTGKARIQVGLGGENFRWKLAPGEAFTAPEAVMTFSENGLDGMSQNFHSFIRAHILPPEPFGRRPVVLNSWEASHFAIDEAQMLRFAESAAEVGIDMLVMDDGWFGARKDDHRALGDWYENREKFKDGLKPFVEKIKAHGIRFGIWVEPEMVNPNSDLYRAHPDWCLHCIGKPRMLSRNQLVLDMGNPQVIEYLKQRFSQTFDGIAIDYFKWDMNRHLSQVASLCLPADRQEETAFRHILGVYELMGWFRTHFPDAMIENCSGGGGRYDLGMMKFSTMIWTSDNTHPEPRIRIQYSSMLGYPAATMSCHVSNRKNACEDPKALQYRFDVAMGGALGYEFHLPNATPEIRDAVREQIRIYRRWEDVILRGNRFNLLSPFDTNYAAYYTADPTADRILVSFLQRNPEEPTQILLPVAIAREDSVYVDEATQIRYTGTELKRGLSVTSDESNCNSKLFYLVREER